MKDINEIKAYDYGYGFLEDKLIAVFSQSGPPDFDTADELLRLGADVNAEGPDDEDNVLSQILCGYTCWHVEDDEYPDLNQIGEYMIQVIHYFLDHGFDVHKKNDRYGAQCLYSLVLSVQNRSMIEATKLFINAGAKNLCVDDAQTEGEDAKSFLAVETSFQDTCEQNYEASNALEATYQIYQAIEDHKPYDAIDSYEAAFGKAITKVMIEKPENGEVLYEVSLPNGNLGKCFYTNMYLVFENQMLIITPYLELWTNRFDPSIQMIDISSEFPQVVGSSIKKIVFNHNEMSKEMTHYTQPVVTFVLKNGEKVNYSTSFGEMSKDTCTAYFYYGEPIIRKENEPGIEKWWC